MKIPALGQKVPLAPVSQILPVLGIPSLKVISRTHVRGVENQDLGPLNFLLSP